MGLDFLHQQLELPDHARQPSPVRVAPLGELATYIVFEHELDIIAAGSPAALAFNLAGALISIGVSFVLMLAMTSIASDRLFYGYLIACINCLLAGVIMFAYWLKTRTSINVTVAKIQESIGRRHPCAGTAADRSGDGILKPSRL